MNRPFAPSTATYQHLIDGRHTHSKSGKEFEALNPSNGEVLATFSDGGEEDANAAVDAALRAYEGEWGRLTPKERSRHLFRFADELRRRQSDFAMAETLDVGRPVALTSQEMGGLADSMEYYAGLLLGLGGETLNISDPTLTDFTLREPLGVCALITPWNYPALLGVLKIAPALAAGNTVVLKPSELTPLSSAMLGECALSSGMPPGAVNVLHGGVTPGTRLVRHPDVAKVSFTGGTATGKKIFAEAAGTVKKLTLELGGKSPLLVFDDADLDAAVAAAFTDNIRNSGQVCAACSRLIVQDEIHDPRAFRLSDQVGRKRRIGPDP